MAKTFFENVSWTSAIQDNDRVAQVAKVNGEQSGEYFGAALAAGDINGDGLDDLIVGSPLYTHTEKSKSSVGFEEGRISIYAQSSVTGKLVLKLSIFGRSSPRSRYGAAVATLGDLDADGFADFVVGAPFEGTWPMPSKISGVIFHTLWLFYKK